MWRYLGRLVRFANLLVQPFGQCFCQPVGQCLQQNFAVIVVGCFEALNMRFNSMYGYCKRTEIVIGYLIGRCHKIG